MKYLGREGRDQDLSAKGGGLFVSLWEGICSEV